MKKFISIVLAVAILMSVCLLAGCAKSDKPKEMKMVWYFPAAHAYGDEVASYVEQFSKDKGVEVKIMVGGAVLTEDYAAAIGADAYCKDAMASVNFAIQCE